MKSTIEKMPILKIMIIAVVSALLLNIGFTTASVYASEVSSKEQVELTNSLLKSITFDKNTNKLFMDEEKLINTTELTSTEASKLATEFNSLSSEEQKDLMKDFSKNNTARVAPIIIWAAGVLGGWLATKLLNWGAHKFCSSYKNYNSITKYVCEVID